MHQIWFWLGLRPRPRWGSLQRSPRLLAAFEGPTSKGGEGKGEGIRAKGREKGGKRGRSEEKGGEEEFVVMWPKLSALNLPLFRIQTLYRDNILSTPITTIPNHAVIAVVISPIGPYMVVSSHLSEDGFMFSDRARVAHCIVNTTKDRTIVALRDCHRLPYCSV